MTGTPLNHFQIQVLPRFEKWYELRLLKSKSMLENLDWINLLKAYDVVLDINQQIQLSGTTVIYIPSLPQMVRFQLLFPADSVGTRRLYQDYRMEGAKYLKNIGVVLDYRYVDDSGLGYGNIMITTDLTKFEDFLDEIGSEYKKRTKAQENNTKSESNKEGLTEKADNKPITKIDAVYEITYTKQREILLNGVKIANPEFDGELLRVTITKSVMSSGQNKRLYKRKWENCKLPMSSTI